MSDHIREIILIRSCRNYFTFLLNKKSKSLNPNGKKKKKKRCWEGALNTFDTIKWDAQNRQNNLLTFYKVFTKPLLCFLCQFIFFLIPQTSKFIIKSAARTRMFENSYFESCNFHSDNFLRSRCWIEVGSGKVAPFWKFNLAAC